MEMAPCCAVDRNFLFVSVLANLESFLTCSTEVTLRNLEPQSSYSIEIQSWGVNNRQSIFSVPILILTSTPQGKCSTNRYTSLVVNVLNI